MKRYFNILGIVFCLSTLASSCEKASSLTLNTPKTINFTEHGGSHSFSFTSNRDWSVSSSDSWCIVSPSSGDKAEGYITVTLSCEPNTTYDPRSTSVTIKQVDGPLTETIKIIQAQTNGLFLGKKVFEVGRDGETIEIQLQTNVEYDVIIPKDAQDWITHEKSAQTKGLVNTSIYLRVAENPTYYNRETPIVIREKGADLQETVLINQKQTDVLMITDEVNKITMPYSGGLFSFGVFYNIDIEIIPSASWIHQVESTSPDLDSFTFIIEDNSLRSERNGKVTIRQKDGDLSSEYYIKQLPFGAIDLGIVLKRADGTSYSLFWADCNLGATKPEEYGDYYAWGETSMKGDYSWSTYKFYNETGYSKYCTKRSYWGEIGEPDGIIELEPEDDVAHVILGNNWRTPTKEEWDALKKLCSWTWINKNGVNGYEVKSNNLENSNCFFLPAAGFKENTNLYNANTVGDYWSSSLRIDYPFSVFNLTFDPDEVFWLWNYSARGNRNLGLTVRPVTE